METTDKRGKGGIQYEYSSSRLASITVFAVGTAEQVFLVSVGTFLLNRRMQRAESQLAHYREETNQTLTGRRTTSL